MVSLVVCRFMESVCEFVHPSHHVFSIFVELLKQQYDWRGVELCVMRSSWIKGLFAWIFRIVETNESVINEDRFHYEAVFLIW